MVSEKYKKWADILKNKDRTPEQIAELDRKIREDLDRYRTPEPTEMKEKRTMSLVTNTILVTSASDDEKIEQVNKFFPEDGQKGFVSCDSTIHPDSAWYGGSKYLECMVYIGAFNYLDLEALKEHLTSIEWERPEAVQLLTMEQEEDLMTSWTIPEDKQRQVGR